MKSLTHYWAMATQIHRKIKSISRRLKLLRTWLPLLFIPAVVQAAEQSMPPAQVKVVALEKRQLAPVTEATGSVISDKNTKISTEIQAAVQWLAPIGKTVEENEVIAKLDPRLYAIAEQQAQAQVKRLKAELVFQQQELDRLKSLIARDNAAKSLYQKEQATFAMLQQDLKSAELQLSKASGDLALTEVKAPFAGVIVNRLAQVGEYLGVGIPLLQLVDHNNKMITISLRKRFKPKSNFSLKLINYKRIEPEYKNLKYKKIMSFLKKMDTTKSDIALYKNKKILESGTSNFLFVKNNKIFSPDKDCYKGTTIKFFSKKIKINFTNIFLNNLSDYDEILIIGSGKGVVSVSSIEKNTWKRKSLKLFNKLTKMYKSEIKNN